MEDVLPRSTHNNTRDIRSVINDADVVQRSSKETLLEMELPQNRPTLQPDQLHGRKSNSSSTK